MTDASEIVPPDHLTPEEAAAAVAAGALLVDVRGERARARDGLVEQAVVVPKMTIVDRFGLRSHNRLALSEGQTVVVFCSSERGSSTYVPIIRSLCVSPVFGVRGGFRALALSGLFPLLPPND